RRDKGAYLNRYVTEEQRSRGRFSSQPSGPRGFRPAALSLFGRRPQRVFSLFASRIQPKYAAAPLYQPRTCGTSQGQGVKSRLSLQGNQSFAKLELGGDVSFLL